MILRISDLAERSECRQRVKILGLGVVKNPSLFWHRLAKGEGPPVEIAAECFSPLFFQSCSVPVYPLACGRDPGREEEESDR